MVVCSEGIGTSGLVSQRLRMLFPEYSIKHSGLKAFNPSVKYDVVVSFESLVPELRKQCGPNQKIRTYEGMFEALGGPGTMENRLDNAGPDADKIKALREYLFRDGSSRERS